MRIQAYPFVAKRENRPETMHIGATNGQLYSLRVLWRAETTNMRATVGM